MSPEAYRYMKETLESIAVNADRGTRKLAVATLNVVAACEVSQAAADSEFRIKADIAGKEFVAACLSPDGGESWAAGKKP